MHGLPERLDGAVAVATADVDEAAELADSRDVSTIPHFVLLRNGVQVCVRVGKPAERRDCVSVWRTCPCVMDN